MNFMDMDKSAVFNFWIELMNLQVMHTQTQMRMKPDALNVS